MNNQPILFVSSRCDNCAKIVATLKSLNKETLCRVFPIDGRQRHELPPFLKGVPTLYVPETKDVFVGNSIYAYIAKPVVARREVPVQQAAPSGALQSGSAPPAAGPSGDYQAWSFEGKGSITDSYSSWDKPGQFHGADQLQYSFLGGGPLAPTAPEPQTKQSFDGAKQGRNDDISSRLEQYKKARDNEFKGITRQ
jgi:hypothetical protein